MKKYIIGFSLLLVGLPLAFADLEAQKRALQAEADRHDAEVLAMNARCSSFVIGSAQDVQCHQEKARLDAWMASILSRAHALTANSDARSQLNSAAKEARKGDQSNLRKNYDEGTAQSDGSVVDARGSGSQRDQISAVPDKYKSNPEIMRYDAEARQAAGKAEKLQQEITKLEQQRNSSANRGAVDVQIAKDRNQLSVAKSTARAAEINKKEKIHFVEGRMN